MDVLQSENIKEQRYWMAYMDMPSRYRLILRTVLFIFNISFIFVDFGNIGQISNIIGSTTVPLMIYTFPGFVFYQFKKVTRLCDTDKIDFQEKGALCFWILGILL
jgi:amino acid permease